MLLESGAFPQAIVIENRAGERTLFDFDKVAEEIMGLAGVDMTRFGFEPPKVEPPDAVDMTLGADGGSGEGAVVCPRCGKVVE